MTEVTRNVLKSAYSLVLLVLGIWIIGYLTIQASAVQSSLQIDAAGTPVSVITPRVGWEFAVATVAVSFAVVFLSFILLEGMTRQSRLARLSAMHVVGAAIMAVGQAAYCWTPETMSYL